MIQRWFLYIAVFFSLFGLSISSLLASERAALREKFADVMVVVNYNHPYYQSIPFLKEIYGDIFPNIVFYGEAASPEVNQVFTHFGYEHARVVAHALKKYPGYAGYIFLQDDCLMNFWNYMRLDKTKIWLSANQRSEFIRETLSRSYENSWNWWESPWGLVQLRIIIPQLSKDELRMLYSNHGDRHVVGLMVDMFYVPGRVAPQVIRLSEIFSKVFCEIAIPTLLSCVDNIENWERLSMLWAGDNNQTLQHYNPQLDWVHPLKFSSLECQKFALQMIEEQCLK